MDLLIVTANGGHLAEMRIFLQCIDNKFNLVTYHGKDSADLPGYRFYDRHNRLLKLLPILFLAPYIIYKERPKCLFCTGGIIAIPFAIYSKLLRIPVVYFECGTRIKTKSGTGVFLYFLASDFFVQSKQLVSVYGRKSKYVGSLL
jgi:beta-1,4-N-acetylglucosaminyltransferase